MTCKMQKILFLHIPKAAGTTFTSILRSIYKDCPSYSFGKNPHTSLKILTNMPEENRKKYVLIYGHFSYGVHNLFADNSNEILYLTLLRDPIQRLISHFNYTRLNSEHPLHKLIISENLDLETYICSGLTTETNNGQVRLLSGIGDTVPFGQVTTEHLEIAKHNLSQEIIYGITEKFDQSLVYFTKVLGWKSIPLYKSQNIYSTNKPSRNFISPRIVDIQSLNNLDLELYDWAVKEFINKLDLALNVETKMFQIKNSFHNIYYEVIWPRLVSLKELSNKK